MDDLVELIDEYILLRVGLQKRSIYFEQVGEENDPFVIDFAFEMVKRIDEIFRVITENPLGVVDRIHPMDPINIYRFIINSEGKFFIEILPIRNEVGI